MAVPGVRFAPAGAVRAGGTVALICVVGAALPYSPLAALFGFVPLPYAYWSFVRPILLAYLGLTQAIKGWLVRRFGLV